ncbi:MAG: dihydrolipoyllysine-residue acetyltransferase [Methylococcus sp.]|nr:MAG: dihydrolipoyllysine-residue acetyltransferase [Methylococcus sp.]
MAAVLKEVHVPDIGDYKDIEVIEVLVKPGDVVQPEDSLITLESDKAAMEVPSPVGGTVSSLNIKPGDRVSKGSLILLLETATETVPVAAPLAAPQAVAAPSIEPIMPPIAAPLALVVPVTASSVPHLESVTVPDIGDFKDIEVIEVLVKPGDVVALDDSLITLESDKSAMEVPSPLAGVVKEIKLKPGDRVSKGALVLVMEVQSAQGVPAAVPEVAPSVAAPVTAPVAAAPTPAIAPPVFSSSESGVPPHATPAIRKFARELGVDLHEVKGTGPKQRISREDVQGYVKASLAGAAAKSSGGGLGFGLPPAPLVDFSRFGAVNAVPLSRIQKLSGPNLHRNWLSIPHITQYDEADITDLEAFRISLKGESEKRGIKLSFLPFVMKALSASLKAHPTFNASLDPSLETLILKHYVHIGVAVDTPEGLVVPVVRDVDQKSVFEIAQELMDLSQKARNKKLRGADLEGGCFTISSLGGIGGTAFTPIINAPEVAILGLSKSQMKPVYQEGQFVPRLMLPLSLSYDHRVIDGASAARFIVHLSSTLADLRRVLL